MRKILGIAVLVLGTGALGWWGSSKNAVRMEDGVRAGASEAAAQSLHGVETSVSGRDITVTGLADTEAERDMILSTLNEVHGRRIVRDDLTILPAPEPYSFSAANDAQGIGFGGHIPTEAARSAVADHIGPGAQALELAHGAPEGWVDAVGGSFDALQKLKTGEVVIEGTEVTLTGLAATPREESAATVALASLPDGFSFDTNIEVEDDGTPLRLNAVKGAGEAQASGKFPSEMDHSTLAVLGVEDTSAVQIARIPSADGLWDGVAAKGINGLAALESGTLDIEDRSMWLRGAGNRAALAAVEADLGALPDGYDARLDLSVYDDGAPFKVEGVKSTDGIAISGKLPYQTAAADLGLAGLDSAQVAEIEAQAPDFQSTVAAGVAALESMERGTFTATGGTVTTSIELVGVVKTPEEEAAVEAALSGVAGARSVDLKVLDDGKPLSLAAAKTGSDFALGGKLPEGFLPAVGATADNLSEGGYIAGVASAEDEAFVTTGAQAVEALDPLMSGTLQYDGSDLSIAGVGTRAMIEEAEAKLSLLPEGVSVASDFSIFDDGAPMGLTVLADGSASGKLPFGTSPADLGLDGFETTVARSEVDANAADFVSTSQAGLSALAALETGTLTVSDSTEAGGNASYTLSGVATRAGEAAAQEALGASMGSLDLTYVDDGAPIELRIGADGAVSGKLPYGTTAADLGLGDLGAARVAEIDALDPNFADVASGGVAALAMVQDGSLAVMDGTPATMTLDGTVILPADRDAVLAALGDGTTANISTLDDGAPADFALNYSATEGATASGKLPAGLTRDQLADALVLSEVGGDVTTGYVGDAETVLPVLTAISEWLPEMETAEVTVAGDGAVDLTGEAAHGADLAVLTDALTANLDGIASVSLTEASVLPATGTERVNAATGTKEAFSGFAWLPRFEFDASAESCNEATVSILERSKVAFLSGSATLDARSRRTVNALSGAVNHCITNDPLLRVEVGGHTDSDGSEEGNLALSQQRADAVTAALVARGVGPGVLTSIGYGEAQPIADNATEEGRAANRRTTFVWNRDPEGSLTTNDGEGTGE